MEFVFGYWSNSSNVQFLDVKNNLWLVVKKQEKIVFIWVWD